MVMNNQSSYRIDSISSNREMEIKRLKSQVELFWDKEIKHYQEFGLKDGLEIVELGCGPGFVIEKLLERFPKSNITGIEIDAQLVEYARNYLNDQALTGFQITEGSIMDSGLPDHSFDFAISRLVLEHLPDPVNAAREVARILKPGGKAIFIDNDFEMHIMTFPQIPELQELYEAYCRSRYAEGGNPKIGRELPLILKQAGFTAIEFEIINAHSAVGGDAIFLQSEGVGIPSKLVRDGFLTSKALAKISIEWRDMLKNNNHAILRQLYLAVGTKTAEGGG